MDAELRCFEILMEDSSADVRLGPEALKQHGAECVLHVAADGSFAISFIKALDTDPESPHLDLVLLDMHLQSDSGDYNLNLLRPAELSVQTPAVVMTRVHSRTAQDTAMKHAVLRFFLKPSRLGGFLELGSFARSTRDYRVVSADVVSQYGGL